MTSICNQLEKLNPPSFVTTTTKKWRVVVEKWSALIVQSRYGKLKNILGLESNVLTGYIERKGTQLRLEKALMFTKQIQKVLLRWKSNDFYAQLMQFQKSIGNFDMTTGYLLSSKSNVSKERLPSSQWTRWVMYLALRDAALLAKISIHCENTIKFWFGLIDAGHHWGDSLVVGAILARIWFCSSRLVEDLVYAVYPRLVEISALVEPNKSGDWPSAEFTPPLDMLIWLRTSMSLPFVPVTKGHFGKMLLSHPKVKEGLPMKFFESIFDLREGSKLIDNSDDAGALEAVPYNSDIEDVGMVVETVPTPVGKKKKRKKVNNNVVADESPSVSVVTQNWKAVRRHWEAFFKNYEKKVRSAAGRKKLVIRIKKYFNAESDPRLKVKLKKLQRIVLRCDDDNVDEVGEAFLNLKTFLSKHVKKLKKSKSE